MGRWSTGAITVGQCLQLNIRDFSKYLKNYKEPIKASITWSSGGSISIELIKQFEQFRLTLMYSKARDGEKNEISYPVYIDIRPSNLGVGEVYFFRCPYRHKRCKVLYMGYGSEYFKSREAYTPRIYYPSQMSSTLDRHNDTYWRLERKLEKVDFKRLKSHYKGKQTRTQKKLETMREKRAYHDKMRWIILPKRLIKYLPEFGL